MQQQKTRKIKCPECGSNDIFKAGFVIVREGKKQLYQCRDCGRKFRGKII